MEAIGETVGRDQILKQADELEKAGIISVDWTSIRTDFKGINFPVANMEVLCKYEGVANPNKRLSKVRQQVLAYCDSTNADWLKKYYQDDLLASLDKGSIPANAEDENMLKLLNALAALENDVWKRKFSADVLNDSKKFKEEYEDRIITVLRNKSPQIDDEMTKDEMLAEHHILSYSQTLECKGTINYEIQDNKGATATQIDTTGMYYGTVINAQTLSNAYPISLHAVKKIITIENKANYENMRYDPDILYIYTHGFLSPKERTFLKKLELLADSSVKFYHWSDLDYGGIRIFNFMKETVFQNIHPIYMDRDSYEKEWKRGAGIKLSTEKREKIENIDAGELEELKECILEYGMEIEQENLM